MLATQRMSSHGGQPNFPFGCTVYLCYRVLSPVLTSSPDQPENLHGIGLPEFMTPGVPRGQPLLNAHENKDFDNFLQGFDQNAAANKSLPHGQFQLPTENDLAFDMPPMFVGSDTAMGQRSIVDPHQLPGGGFPYGNGLLGHDMHSGVQHDVLASGIHGPSYADPTFQNQIMGHLQHSNAMQPAYTPGWQTSFTNHNILNMPAQSRMGNLFGTDARFQPTGYAAPHNPMDPDIPQGLQMQNPIGEWLEPTSASTTQPNTQPNTQPSSPNWSKKRNFDDFALDQLPRNGLIASTRPSKPAHPSPPQSNPRRKRSVAKPETTAQSQPPTPLSNQPLTPLGPDNAIVSGSLEQEEDAEAEDEDEEAMSPPDVSWPSSKPRQPRSNNTSAAKAARKKKGTTPASATKPKKPTMAKQSSSTRVPLSVEQKKANHTNSEQRRRDATARAYAELYDLVPELEDIGKQSTMKKLEVVVTKVRTTKERVEELRAKLGMDPLTGRMRGGVPTGGASGVLMYSDMPGWHR
jgi:hypothetical protein